MSDDIEQPRRGYNTEDIAALGDEPSAPEPRRRRRRWPWVVLATLVIGPLVIFSLWAWLSLSYTYSTGERAGFIQKFSEKGWICKTWEGELALVNLPGTMQEIFYFTVRDDAVADEILDLMRTHDGRIALTYEQHKAVPTSCFGETEYFVTAVQPVRMPGAAPTAPAAQPGVPATPAPRASGADSGR